MEKEKIKNEAKKWYIKNQSLYKKLSKKIQDIINEVIKDSNIDIHTIYSREKGIDSFIKKIENDKYDDPIQQVTDLAGIRVIAYVEDDVDKIYTLVKKCFKVDKRNTIDKSKILGIDKVGYKSIHVVATIKDDRIALPEYQKFKDRKFEIQIRTILQHAWAEIEHDRDYKFTGELPINIKRRFRILAGTLELVDREFNEIAREIDILSAMVQKGTEKGDLEFEINSTTLKEYISTKFHALIENGLNPTFSTKEGEIFILNEIRDFGIKTLSEFDKIIDKDFIENYLSQREDLSSKNFLGLIRDILIISNSEQYFDKSWKNHWGWWSDKDSKFYKLYKIPVESLRKKYKLTK